MTPNTTDEIRNELFIALFTIRQIENSMFEFSQGKGPVSPDMLRPTRRHLENARTSLEKAYANI